MLHHDGSHTSRLLCRLCCVLVLCGGLVAVAQAMHQIDHRFTIYGTVRDGRTFPGKFLADQEIVVRDAQTKEVLQQGRSNAQGKFALVLHLHNSDHGKHLSVHVDGVEKSVVVTFDPVNADTARRTRLDFVLFPP